MKSPAHNTPTPPLLEAALQILGVIAFCVVCTLGTILCGGCVYKGAKVVEGTDLAIGLTIPQTDGAAQLDVLNWLSGFRLGVAENSALTVRYTTAETNSYFGCVTTRTMKTVDATVQPCEGGTHFDASAEAEEDR